jgi:hypothetical protein
MKTPTNHEVVKSTKGLLGIEQLNKTGEKKPSINELEIGLRKGKIEKIDVLNLKSNGWYVVFDDNGEKLQTFMGSDFGLEWTPDGDVKSNFLYPNPQVEVGVLMDSLGKARYIVTATQQDYANYEVGVTRLIRGSCKIAVHKDYIEISAPKIIINGEEWSP